MLARTQDAAVVDPKDAAESIGLRYVSDEEADNCPAFIARAKCQQAIDKPPKSRTVASIKGVLMSDCLHCDILDMLERRQGKETDLRPRAAAAKWTIG